MAQSLLEIAKDLTLTLVEAGRLSSEDMQDSLQRTHATLTALKVQEEFGTTTATPVAKTPAVNWRKSITKHAVACLECGQSFKQLSLRHLQEHGLDSRSYRTKYGIPRAQPLAAKTTTARRKQIAQERRPWENAPTFRKGQERDGHTSPKPEADTSSAETEAPTAEAPASPKRERKTTPKKTTRKKRSEG